LNVGIETAVISGIELCIIILCLGWDGGFGTRDMSLVMDGGASKRCRCWRAVGGFREQVVVSKKKERAIL
jgi:hypothetical protein